MERSSYTRRKRRRTRKYILLGIVAVILLLGALLLCLLLRRNRTTAPAPETPPEDVVPPAPTVTLSLPQSFIDTNTASKYIVLYDLNAQKTLYSKEADTPCYPASMTKLLTALVAVTYADDSTVFTVGEEIGLIDPESSRAYLRIGNRLDLQTLLEALLLPSGNDAAYTIAASVGRIIAENENLSTRAAIDVFCGEMNKTAAALGATHSHFANPDGIHDANHYTTANDMLLIAKAAYEHPLISAVMREASVTRPLLSGGTGATWYNTNYLLRTDTRYYYDKATGLKTGHTDQAGYCLAASAEKDGARLIAVLMGGQTGYGRFEDATGLFTVCFDSLS